MATALVAKQAKGNTAIASRASKEAEILDSIMDSIKKAKEITTDNKASSYFVCEIRETNCYDRFKKFEINRTVRKTKNLEESMKKYGFSSAYPLVCTQDDEFLVIRAGHHRFETAKKLNIPVKYIVVIETEIPNIYEAEKSTNTWNLQDHLASQVRADNEIYIKVERFHKRTGIPITLCLGLFNGRVSVNHFGEAFKQGKFDAKNIAFAERIGKIVCELKNDYNIQLASAAGFVTALANCSFIPEFKDADFLKKAKSFPSMFKKCANISQYLEMIESIYNYHRSDKIFFAKRAESLAQSRMKGNNKSIFDED